MSNKHYKQQTLQVKPKSSSVYSCKGNSTLFLKPINSYLEAVNYLSPITTTTTTTSTTTAATSAGSPSPSIISSIKTLSTTPIKINPTNPIINHNNNNGLRKQKPIKNHFGQIIVNNNSNNNNNNSHKNNNNISKTKSNRNNDNGDNDDDDSDNNDSCDDDDDVVIVIDKDSSAIKRSGNQDKISIKIPEVYRKQGTATYCCSGGSYAETACLCSTIYDESSSLSATPTTANSLVTRSTANRKYSDRRNWITTERLYELRKKAQDAIKTHRTFTIRGCFYSIRKGLLERGWVEKLDVHRRSTPIIGLCQIVLEDFTHGLPQRRPGESHRQHLLKCERNIMSRFLEHMPIDFLWSARKEKTDWIDMARNPTLTINKFHKCPFTSKEGLCTVLRDFHWYFETGKSETHIPRCYNVWHMDDLAEFIDNFRLTACIATIRFIIERKYQSDGLMSLCCTSNSNNINDNTIKCDNKLVEDGNINNNNNNNNNSNNTDINSNNDSINGIGGKLPISFLEFAMKQCKTYIRSCLHYDIDEEVQRIWDHDWEQFLMQFQMLTQENAKFFIPGGGDGYQEYNAISALTGDMEKILIEIKQYFNQFILDGFYNIWIIKPANKCRGRGIYLMNDLKKILNFVNPPILNKGRFVVQKYIERPLIIHNCKFDIRQWFLVTSVQPLIIWMYKDSYLRFSSQQFNLINFHESVHLTNHAVQKRYRNGKRDERLPKENMWDCLTFQSYLRQIDKAEMWSERIYPGMQKALIGTMLASQDSMDRRLNTFELFGADFMITEDFQPWLIEINSSPDLSASTTITARLCPQCLEDVVKVVIDYRNDPKSSTGGFELIYRQNIPPAPAYLGLNLFLKGNQISPKIGLASTTTSHYYRKDNKHHREIIKSSKIKSKDSVFGNTKNTAAAAADDDDDDDDDDDITGGDNNRHRKLQKDQSCVMMDLIDCLTTQINNDTNNSLGDIGKGMKHNHITILDGSRIATAVRSLGSDNKLKSVSNSNHNTNNNNNNNSRSKKKTGKRKQRKQINCFI